MEVTRLPRMFTLPMARRVVDLYELLCKRKTHSPKTILANLDQKYDKQKKNLLIASKYNLYPKGLYEHFKYLLKNSFLIILTTYNLQLFCI